MAAPVRFHVNYLMVQSRGVMTGDRGRRMLARRWTAAGLGIVSGLLLSAAQPAAAESCPGNPGALGTSRTLVVDPREHPRIGTMQYAESLPLADHEVVLTFDDGPLPHNTNRVLDILAAQCVKATFFLVGRMARDFPSEVRKLRAAGHTIGTHSQNHPLSFDRMSIDRARQEIDDGIAATTTALGDPSAVAPFFRIPGLLRAEAVEGYLASQGIQTWSADFPADDWRPISSARVFELAISRIEARRRGILLLHDIQPRTVAALPRLLHELKARGYRIVHVVPATPDRPATPTDPQLWRRHPVSETVAISHWPAVPPFVFAKAESLPAPGLSDSDLHDGRVFTAPTAYARTRLARGAVPLPRQPPWPRLVPLSGPSGANALPVPAQALFSIPEQSPPSTAATLPLGRRADGVQIPVRSEVVKPEISLDSRSASRPISGSLPVTRPGLQRGPLTMR